MSDEQNDPTYAEPLQRSRLSDNLEEARSMGALAVMEPAAQTIIQMASRDYTARKVAVARNLQKILADLRTLCASWGETYVWSWEVWDNKLGRKVPIEGGTIKLANDLVGLWGNCSVECEVSETPTHWIFKAWFMDAEKGVATSRLFQQRKSQNIGGKMDPDRAMDMVFQIGQSKAIRNVVLNALPSLANEAIEMSKGFTLDLFRDEANAKKAQAFIDRVLDEYKISNKRAEGLVGRIRSEWTVRDLAKVYMTARGVREGMVEADEAFPTEATADRVRAEREDEKASKRKEAEKAKPKDEGKSAERPQGPAEGAEAGQSGDGQQTASAAQSTPAASGGPKGEPETKATAQPAGRPAETKASPPAETKGGPKSRKNADQLAF